MANRMILNETAWFGRGAVGALTDEVKSVTTVEELLAQQKACDAAPTCILLKNSGLHIELQIDANGRIGKDDSAHINDVSSCRNVIRCSRNGRNNFFHTLGIKGILVMAPSSINRIFSVTRLFCCRSRNQHIFAPSIRNARTSLIAIPCFFLSKAVYK